MNTTRTRYGDPEAYTARQRLNGALARCGITQPQFDRWSRATRLGVGLDRYDEVWCDKARAWLEDEGGAAEVLDWLGPKPERAPEGVAGRMWSRP